MKTIITMITLAAFLYVLYKKSVQNKKRNAPSSEEDVTNNPLSLLPGSSSIPVCLPCGGENTRYEVLVFDMQSFATSTLFEEHIKTMLELKTKEMTSRCYPYRFDFLTINTSIVVLVTYEMSAIT